MNANENSPGSDKILVRYKDPSRFDTAPYGQLWKAIGEDEHYEVWTQISHYEAEPCWITITHFFNKNFQELLKDPTFTEAIKIFFD